MKFSLKKLENNWHLHCFSLQITLTVYRDPIYWGRKCVRISTFSQTMQKWAELAGEVKDWPVI
jgi:hypothetical protein